MENASKTGVANRRANKTQDATALLRDDHKRVASLFADYQEAPSRAKKKQLVAEICSELTVHAQIEEEIFYPALRRALDDKELIPEAAVEHATLKALVAQLEGSEPDGELFDAKVKVLSEYVNHHVKEEQQKIFPQAKSADVDLSGLGVRLAERKAELMAQRS